MIIGVPVYNDLENLQKMIQSLIASTTEYDKIILVVSDANGKEKIWLDTLPSKVFEIIHTPKLGPLDAYNRLFEIAKERKKDLFLTQTDVTFPKARGRDWLAEMEYVAKFEDAGLVTCYGGGGISGRDFMDGFKWVGAWCTYIPYKTIERIGGYDMKIPLGWGVDIDYSYAVKDAGLICYEINYWVDHHPNYVDNHESEKVDNIEELKQEAFAYLKNKWKFQIMNDIGMKVITK